MQHIQGEERNQLQLFCLEQMVEADSFVRVIDYFVDSIDLASFGFRHVSVKEEGRPPYHSVHRSVNGAGLFGIASRYVAVRSKALPCILKQNMESWSFPFINDEARRFAKHRVAQVIRYEELGIVKSLSFF